MEAVNKGMAKGAFWMILFRFVTRGIGLISTVILARLLMPADFGLVAMAMTIIAAFELMSAFSLDVVLIQNRDAGRSHYDTAWTFSVIAAALQALILFAIAPWVAHFYSDQRLTAVVWLLALGVLVQGFENIGIVAFRKDMEFHKDFKFQVAKKLVSFAVTMALAFWFRNYWALVGGMLVSRVMGVAFSFIIQPYRPRFSLEAKGELFHFSKWLFINNLLFFANNQSANFILGKLAGPHALGLFTLSYEISNLPSTDLVAPINRAIFPGYAKMAHDLSMLRQGFLNVLAPIALVSFPICTGIALTAEPLVYVMLGKKWQEAIPLIQILALAGLTQAVQNNKGSVYLALGRPRILTLLAGVHVLMTVPAIILGALKFGALGAAKALLVVLILQVPMNYVVLFRVLKLQWAEFLRVIWRPFSATIIMVAVTQSVIFYLPESDTLLTNLLNLSVESTVGIITYLIAVALLWKIFETKPTIENLIFNKVSQFIVKIYKKFDKCY